MRPRLQLSFRDFWPGFEPESSFLVRALRSRFDVAVIDRGGILVYGPFGSSHTSFSGVKVYCSAEALPLPAREHDFSISWHPLPSERHLRLPLYAWTLLESPVDLELLRARTWSDWSARPHFCNFIYSNWGARRRRDFFRALSRRRFVHAPGEVENNVAPVPGTRSAPGWRAAKLAYQRDFRFTIAFENEPIAGYTSEKAVDALVAGTIPIYWGNREVGEDVDRAALICAADFASLDELADYVCALDDDRAGAQPYFDQPALPVDALKRWESDLVALFEQADEAAARLRPSRVVRPGRLTAGHELNRLKVAARVRAARLTRLAIGAPARTYLGLNGGSTAVGQTDLPDVTIASAANNVYFDALLTLIASIHRHDDLRVSLVCLDLGLQARQRSLLERIEGVQVWSIPETLGRKYPHLLEPRTFAWKIWLLNELASADRPFLYVDAGACFIGSPGEAFEVIRRDGILLVDVPNQTNGRWTHQAARSIMAVTDEELAAHQLWAGMIGAAPTATARMFLREALALGLDPVCIRGGNHEHRHDQSILSVLAERMGLPRVSIERYGEWRGVIHDDQVIYVHRGARIDHSGLRWACPPAVQSLVRLLVRARSRDVLKDRR